MEEFFQQLTNGLAVGGIYALIALGYTMVYGVLKLINFAHGDLFTYGAYLGLTLLTSLALTDRLGFALGVVVLVLMVMGLVAVLGAILERAAYRPLRESPRLSAVVSALGASIFLFTMALKASTALIGIPTEVWQWVSGGLLIALGLVGLFAHVWEGIAAKLSLPLGTVKTQIHRAREQMCRLIAQGDERRTIHDSQFIIHNSQFSPWACRAIINLQFHAEVRWFE